MHNFARFYHRSVVALKASRGAFPLEDSFQFASLRCVPSLLNRQHNALSFSTAFSRGEQSKSIQQTRAEQIHDFIETTIEDGSVSKEFQGNHLALNKAFAAYMDCKLEGITPLPETRLLLLESSTQMQVTLQVLSDMELEGEAFGNGVYNTALHSCAIAGATKPALNIVSRMGNRDIFRTYYTYQLVIRAHARARLPGKAFEFYKILRENGTHKSEVVIKSHLVTYLTNFKCENISIQYMTAAINACNPFDYSKSKRQPDISPKQALKNAKFVFGDFLELFGDSPTVTKGPYNAILGVSSRLGDLDYAFEVFDIMNQQESTAPNSSSYEILMMQLMSEMSYTRRGISKKQMKIPHGVKKTDEWLKSIDFERSVKYDTRKKRNEKVLSLFAELFEKHVPPTDRIMDCAEASARYLKSSEALQKVELGREIFNEMINDQSWRPDVRNDH